MSYTFKSCFIIALVISICSIYTGTIENQDYVILHYSKLRETFIYVIINNKSLHKISVKHSYVCGHNIKKFYFSPCIDTFKHWHQAVCGYD